MDEDLLIRFLNGECTPEEEHAIKDWMDNPEKRKRLNDILEARWNNLPEPESEDKQNALPLNIRKAIQQNPGSQSVEKPADKEFKINRRIDFTHYIRVAASFLIFFVSGFFVIKFFYQPTPKSNAVAEIKIINKTSLIGQKLTFMLPDGSSVNLNSGSSLEFPEHFSDSGRTVHLTGEAFFKIAHDSLKPFKVYSKSAVTTVLGTHFNVNERENVAQVTLAEGKVHVAMAEQDTNNYVVLSPGEMAVINPVENLLQVEIADLNEILSWKRGEITFKNQKLDEVFSKLENWYGVQIEARKGVNLESVVSGKFANENLENILSGLSFTLNFQFEISGKNVTISKNDKNS